jgi:hypothetical protein
LEEQDTLERIFRTRGYKVIRSSRDNHYLLLKKGGSLMAVGYSMSSRKTTEGEAEMFISMGQNDSADSMLYISPIKLSRAVKGTFEKEGVATWDRMALSIALGEQVLADWSIVKDERQGERSVLDLFDTEDVDPVKEVRTFHTEISSGEIGGFKVREVDIGSGEKLRKRGLAPQAVKLPVEDQTMAETEPVVEENGASGGSPPEFDLPMMPMMDMVTDEPVIEREEKIDQESHKVPDDILMGPWTGFDEWRDRGKGSDDEKEPSKVVKKEPLLWEGATLAPVKYSQSDAVSLADEKGNIKLQRINYPFLILEASYMMVPEDGSDPVEEDGTYLYDCIRSDVSDIPGSLYDEIAAMEDRWNGDDGPKELTDPKVDHNSAMVAIREKIKSGRLAKDRKVRETLMSTIYREIEYRFDPNSLKLISSRRVMLPFWIRQKKKGKKSWSVNAFLGQLVK